MRSVGILLVASLLNCGLTSASFGGSKGPQGATTPESAAMGLQDKAEPGNKKQEWAFRQVLWKYRWYLGTGTAILAIAGIGYQTGALDSMGKKLSDFFGLHASGKEAGFDSLRTELGQVQGQVNALETQLQEQKGCQSGTLVAMETRLKALDAQIKELKDDQITANQGAVSEVQGGFEGLRKEFGQVQNQVNGLEKQQEELNKSIKTRLEERNQLSDKQEISFSAVQEQTQQIENLSNTLKRLQEDVMDLKRIKSGSNEMSFEDLAGSVTSSVSRIQELEGSVSRILGLKERGGSLPRTPPNSNKNPKHPKNIR